MVFLGYLTPNILPYCSRNTNPVLQQSQVRTAPTLNPSPAARSVPRLRHGEEGCTNDAPHHRCSFCGKRGVDGNTNGSFFFPTGSPSSTVVRPVRKQSHVLSCVAPAPHLSRISPIQHIHFVVKCQTQSPLLVYGGPMCISPPPRPHRSSPSHPRGTAQEHQMLRTMTPVYKLQCSCVPSS